jgi:ADP-heptose:LPS heptosyltransferase
LDERFHYVRRYLSLIGEEGREISSTDFYFPVENPPSTLPAGPILAVAPGSRAPARRWFPERFAAVIDAAPQKSVVILGAPEDAPWAEAVAAKTKRPVVNLCGKTTLPQLAGILKKCAALLANESGLMHVAWAVGTPTVVVAGPSEPRSTSPYGAAVKVLQHREIPCVPCVKNECYRLGADHMACLKAVAPAEASAALAALPQ